MQFMQMLKASLKPGRSILASLVMISVVTTGLFALPRLGESNTSAATCANPPSVATFNYWPVTYADDNTPLCHDFPAIDAAVDVTNPQFSQNEADYNNGLTLEVGQQAAALMYLHNGAANNLPTSQTTAKNVKVITQTDTSVGSSHQISVTYTADNAAPYTKSFTVHTPENAKLEVIPNTGFMYDYESHVILDQQNLNLGNSTFDLGDLDACFEYSIFLSFKFKVVGTTPTPTNTTLSIDKSVRNAGNGSFTQSVDAPKGSNVEYKIDVANTGTNVAKNVTVTDNGVSGFNINSGSVTVDGTAQNGLPGTITLGDMQPGQHKIVRYTATVSQICSTYVNTASAVATNAPSVSDTASVTVTTCIQPPVLTPGLSIQKWVKNNTTNNSYADSTGAFTNDRVNFKIAITNTGNGPLNNAVITDAIPAGLEFNDSVSTDGISRFDEGTLYVSFRNPIAPGESKTVEFAAIVKATGTITVCNVAKATGTGVTQVQDNACVNVTTPIVLTPGLSIQKWVKNNTTNNSYADSTGAFTNDRVNFKITITNTGTGTLNNAVIADALPAGLEFNDSVSTDGTSAFSGTTLTVSFPAILAGQSKTVEFAAIVKATGTTTVCNVAKATGTGVNEVQDNACVNVTTPPNPTNPKIAIQKWVKNITTSGSYDASSVNARTGERVTFKITVNNPGDATLNNVKVTDVIPTGLKFDDNVTGDGTASFANTTFSVDFGSIAAGQSKTVEFTAQVLATGDTTICNVAKATGNNVNEVNDNACVKVYTTPKPGEAHIVLSKKAYNDTQKVDATTKAAVRGDYIIYTLTTKNDGTADKTDYVISDDLSQVLPLADMVSLDGGSLNGNTISYPAMTIKAGETVTKTFKVRVKQTLNAELTYQLRNTYGNTVVINVPGKIVYQAPTTGAAGTSAAAFAGLVTAGFVIARKRGSILKFIFA